MIRNFKILGIAVVAALALSAVAASAASAQNGRLTSTGNVTLTGTEIAGKVNALTFNGIVVQCLGSTYTGHQYNVTPHTFIPSGAETATITPKYKEPCKSTVGPTTIDLNGCDYVIHLGKTTTGDTYSVTYDLICPSGKDITVTNWFNAEEHENTTEACVLHIAPQNNLQGGTITDTTKGDLELGGAVKVNVVETEDKLHKLLCPAKEGVAELDLGVTVVGDNEAKTETSISLSHL